jgi:hypothetical protein
MLASSGRPRLDMRLANPNIVSGLRERVQAIIDGAPPGSEFVFNGDYPLAINETNWVSLPSNCSVLIPEGSQLRMIPTAGPSYRILSCDGVENVIIHGGGVVIGDVQEHLGSTGEFGHGIDIRASTNITIERVHVGECWGDGIYVGGSVGTAQSKRITLRDVKCRANRRQGLTVTHCDGLYVENSVFSHTGFYGLTAPGAGVDLEPNGATQSVVNARFVGCVFAENAASGFAALVGPTRAVLVGCHSYSNLTGAGYYVTGSSQVSMHGCEAYWNATRGAIFHTVTGGQINGGQFWENIGNGIVLFQSSGVDIAPDAVFGNTLHGFSLDRANDCRIRGGRVWGNSQETHNTSRNINVLDCDRLEISGLSFPTWVGANKPQRHIHLDANCVDTAILGCRAVPGAVQGLVLNDLGTGTVIAGSIDI